MPLAASADRARMPMAAASDDRAITNRTRTPTAPNQAPTGACERNPIANATAKTSAVEMRLRATLARTWLLISASPRTSSDRNRLSADVVGTDNQAAQQFGAALAQLTDPVRFPALHRALASGALEDDDGLEAEFDFGLQCILDGVATLIDTHRPPRSSTHRR